MRDFENFKCTSYSFNFVLELACQDIRLRSGAKLNQQYTSPACRRHGTHLNSQTATHPDYQRHGADDVAFDPTRLHIPDAYPLQP